MSNMEYILWAVLILVYNVSDVLSVLCTEKRSFGYGYDYFYCNYGCCGSTYSRYCCPRTTYTYHNTTYISTEASVAIGICVVCFFIGVVIAAVCYKKKYYGRVLRTGMVGPQNMNTIQVTTTTMAGPPLHPYSMQPPPAYAASQTHPPMNQHPPAQMNASQSNPGYIPPPPTYSAPQMEYGVAPPSYSQAENFSRKY